MRKTTITGIIFVLLMCLSLPVKASLWRSYTAYSEITQVQKVGNTLYVLASKRLFAYNTADESVQTFDRINGLTRYACGLYILEQRGQTPGCGL